MTPKPLIKSLSPKVCVKIGQWKVRTTFERGKCAQGVKDMGRYGISNLGVSEMRWNSCGKMVMTSGETVLYFGLGEGRDFKVGIDNTDKEEVMGRHGVRAE